jgi:hypothetical protein
MKNDQADIKTSQILLMHNVGVHCDKDIKFRFDTFQQRPVGDTRPTLSRNCGHSVILEIPHETHRQAFVQNDLHAGTASNTSRLAASNTATTCSLVTVGKSYKKRSIESPSSKQSNKFFAGTRVPAKTGSPPRTSGDDVMIFSKPFMCNNMPKKPEQRKSPHRYVEY